MASYKETHSLHAAFLPEDNHFRYLKGFEELGRGFQFEVTFYADLKKELEPKKVLGAGMAVKVTRNDKPRYFHGIVTDFRILGKHGGYLVYRVELRPEFWLLTQQFDCRIFQEKSVIEIFDAVMKDGAGFTDYKKSVSKSYDKLSYCTQYRESSYDFICRLLEKEGITFYFQYEEKKHIMVLTDDAGQKNSVPNEPVIKYRPPGESQVGESVISRFQSEYRLRSGKVTLDDFDYEKPKSKLESKATQSAGHKHDKLERYDYPGKYLATKTGNDYSKIELESIRQEYKVSRAFGNSIGLSCGYSFGLKEHPEKDKNGDYVITRAEFEVESGEIEQMGSTQSRFEVEMDVIDKTEIYRTPPTTPKPFIRGPQTAIVVGKSSEEIWTDKLGRVKVQFHWDRLGKSDENSSCWIRVAQGWAGKNWGMIYIPRIGHEVIVEFLEGDPDRPIITGSLYNGENSVPYALPTNQTQSGILTHSTKQGKKDLANELRFEDKKDSEEIYFHAEKDFNRVVENNDTLKVGFDKKKDGNQTIEIYNDQTLEIEKGNRKETIKTGNDTLEVTKGNKDTTIKQGNCTIKAKAGKINIEAATEITLKVGGSKLTIKPAEIVLQATNIKIKGQVKSEVTGVTVDVKASGMANVKGGIVKIN